MMRYTFDQAMEVIRREQRREFWADVMVQVVVFGSLAVIVGSAFVWLFPAWAIS